MQGALGEKIGEGAAADIYAWAPGQVLKLFKTGVPRRSGLHEAKMTRAVFAAGGPAPEVLGEITHEGRYGVVLPRLDGPTLLARLQSRAMTLEEAAAILAKLFLSVHQTPTPAAIPSLRDWIEVAAQATDGIPKHIAAGVLALVERLPPPLGLCHGDLHTSNVIMTAEGPRIIDWLAAVRAPAAFDLGRLHLLMTELVPDRVDPERPRALNALVQAEYARLAGLSAAALTAAQDLCLPILRAMALADRVWTPAQRKQLTDRVEAALR
jgi:Ser/Thr protein kinase RdoA (MazF antagonist)